MHANKHEVRKQLKKKNFILFVAVIAILVFVQQNPLLEPATDTVRSPRPEPAAVDAVFKREIL